MSVALQANTDSAFLGGSQKRNLTPPDASAAIAAAQTGVSNPLRGVNPSPIKRARNNQGSNIGVPYTRLTPLESRKNALRASPQDAQDPQKLVTETEDLQAATLAFILGVRGAGQRTDPEDHTKVLSKSNSIRGRKVLGDERTIYNGHGVAMHSGLMSGVGGPMQYHQIGSLEFVRSYFANVLASEVVPLSLSQVGAHRSINDRSRSSGRVGAFEIARRRAADYGLNAVTGGRPEQPPERSTLTRMQDVARQLSFSGADSRRIAANGGFVESPRLQGIFHCSLGPFLRGKGTTSRAVFGTPNNQPHMPMGATPDDPDMKLESAVQPFTLSRNAGDELAFGYLDALMTEHGIKDWMPDGVCLSKGQDDPSDKLSDEYLKARDAQLCRAAAQTTTPCIPSRPVPHRVQVQRAHRRPGHLLRVQRRPRARAPDPGGLLLRGDRGCLVLGCRRARARDQ